MNQLIKPNFVYEKAGWCLSFVRRSYGLPARYKTAYAAWSDTKHKHHDRNFPQGVSFPVWFEWWGDLQDGNGWHRYDHVAIYHTDGKVWSSPLTGHGRAWFNSVDDLIRSFGNGMKYLGWSEDIGSVKVIGEENTMDRETVNYIKRAAFDKEPTAEEVKYWVGRDAKDWAKACYDNNESRRYKANHYDRDIAAAKKAMKVSDAEKRLRQIKDALDI